MVLAFEYNFNDGSTNRWWDLKTFATTFQEGWP
jgi:hypothetical protein